MAVNVVVASGNFTHAFHAVFLPIPIMEDTMSACEGMEEGQSLTTL